MKHFILFIFQTIIVFSGQFINYGPSELDCNVNYSDQVRTLVDQMGIIGVETPKHYTKQEYETLLAIIDEEDSEIQPLLLQGFSKRKLDLIPIGDLYDNYRFKVIAMVRNLGITDDKLTGLPLHFNQAEYDGLQELVQNHDQNQALQLIRGFISHKVQINPNDTCLLSNAVEPSTSHHRSTQTTKHTFTIKVWSHSEKMQSSTEPDADSAFFKLFSKIKKIW